MNPHSLTNRQTDRQTMTDNDRQSQTKGRQLQILVLPEETASVSEWGFTRPSSVYFSLGIVRDIVPLFIATPIIKRQRSQQTRIHRQKKDRQTDRQTDNDRQWQTISDKRQTITDEHRQISSMVHDVFLGYHSAHHQQATTIADQHGAPSSHR